jgi:phosphoserine aminotransferase
MDLRCSSEVLRSHAASGYSFSAAAGPLPPAVVEEVAGACRAWRDAGSILSLPFTAPAYRELQDETEACLRRLLAIPAHFRVLFMHGGASTQFAAVPLNLMGASARACYVDTGHWSRRALREAMRYGEVRIAAGGAAEVPDPAGWRIDPAAAYCHLTTNETADGLQFPELPAVAVPLVADMTSDLLTRPLDFSRLALGYAGTQKTIGVPGLTLVIVREDLLGHARPGTPRVLDYTAQAGAASRLNTPPVFPIFVAHRMLHWIEGEGGVAAMAATVARRSAAVHATIDGSGGFYLTDVAPAFRSRVNPCLRLADPALTERFLREAEHAGLRDLGGHRQVGGIRVSLYNGLPETAVGALVAFLDAFRRAHG